MHRALGWFGVALLISACGGRTLGGPFLGQDASVARDAQTSPEAGPPPDAGGPGCPSDQFHVFNWQRLTRMDLLMAGPASEGQTVRIALELTLTGCQQSGGVSVDIDEAARTVIVAPVVWDLVGPLVACPDAEWTITEYVELANLPPGDWLVTEALSGLPGLMATFSITPCGGAIDCFCAVTTPVPAGPAEPCDFNCECEPGLNCLRHFGMLGSYSICGQSCNADAQCPGGQRCAFTDDGPEATCVPDPWMRQCPDNGCPPGQDCVDYDQGGNNCQATFGPGTVHEPCQCDQDCSVGHRCVDLGGDDAPRCHAACQGVRGCPAGVSCRPAQSGRPRLCDFVWP